MPHITRRALLASAATTAPMFVLPSGVTAASRRRIELVARGCVRLRRDGRASRACTRSRCGRASPGSSAPGTLQLEIARDEGFAQRRPPPATSARRAVRDFTARATVRSQQGPAARRALLLPLRRRAAAPRRSAASPPRARPTRASRCASASGPARAGPPACYPAHAGAGGRAGPRPRSSASATTSTRAAARTTRSAASTTSAPTARPRRSTSTAQKYRLYLTDPDLRAMHASAAFAGIWDDHEAENNYAGDERGDARRRAPARRLRDAPAQRLHRLLRVRPAQHDPAASATARTGGSSSAAWPTSCCSTRASTATTRPATRRSMPCEGIGDRDRARCSARPQRAWLKGALSESQGDVEGHRQPGR